MNEPPIELLQVLDQLQLDSTLLGTILQVLHERSVSKEIALEALAVAEGRGSVEKLTALSSSLSDTSIIEDEKESEFVDDDLEILHTGSIATPGLRWRLQSLNEMLGSLRRGDFGFVFARPESGKTTFLASEVTYFAGQTDKPILWFN